MKRILFSFILTTYYLLLTTSVLAAEKINDFQSEVKINIDGTIDVLETINYDFDGLSKHGIYRTIPTVKTNQDGKKYQMDFKIQGVIDEAGGVYNYTTSFKDTNLKIKIGDPNRKITGIHTYIINYQVSGALTYFSNHDELFWNVTGNDWQVPIDSVSVLVKLPEEITAETKTICYTGKAGSKEQFCQTEQPSINLYKINSTDSLNAYEGLTFAVSFPKGIVQVLEPREYGKKTIFDILLGILIVLGIVIWYLLAPFYIIYLWYRYGRDPEVGKPVTAWYDPPKDKSGRPLTPAEVGTLVDEKADNRDLTATIVSLAIRGYLKIKEEKAGLWGKKYRFIKKNFTSEKEEIEKRGVLLQHELLILNDLFNTGDQVTTEELIKKDFYLTFQDFQKDLYQKVVSLGFFPENPNTVRTKYIVFNVLAIITANIPLAILLFVLGHNMPRKTIEGAKAKIISLGLKNFLSSQERQLEFQVKNWFMFEKLLPYAIVFGVEKIWAERFKDLKVEPPDWYEGDYGRTFNTVYFANALSSSLTSVNSITMSPTRSSSGFSSGFGGGGSSGGGGGGGGGGSW